MRLAYFGLFALIQYGRRSRKRQAQDAHSNVTKALSKTTLCSLINTAGICDGQISLKYLILLFLMSILTLYVDVNI